jgi:hypothetical protein
MTNHRGGTNGTRMTKGWIFPGVMAFALVAGAAAPASAQLDPLLFLKTGKQPNVLLVVDVAHRMQRDADENYYDTFVYQKTGVAWEATIGVTSTNAVRTYRRKYVGLVHTDSSLAGDRFATTSIVTVGDLEAGYLTFEERTRLSVARRSLIQAVTNNAGAVRFGLLKMRQQNVQLAALANEGPVLDALIDQASPSEAGAAGRWKISRPLVDAPNGFVATVQAPVVKADVATANTDVLSVLGKFPNLAGGLIPAGNDGRGIVDAPVENMLVDAKTEAARLIAADAGACRNTVVVLVVGGSEGNTAASQNPAGRAAEFLNVSGHRVPIYVIAIAPSATDNVAQLQQVASASGGQYVAITKAMIEAVAPGQPVPELVRAVNTAVQHTFAAYADFNTAPTALLPFGPSTEQQVTSPIVGTVNLANAHDINGGSLPNTAVTAPSGSAVPQRANVMVTSGFAVPGPLGTPGFPGRLRGFRVYKPVADSTKPSGYKFVGDGTPLWLAGAPAADARNIYTVLPDGTVTPFTTANATALAPYLRTTDAAALITYVRGLPLGAVIDGTPAVLEPPSLDPPPDADYPGFAADNKDRRSLVFVGLNDGMLHAIDGRLGVEVWAFIPFNLLPKLRALPRGQPVGGFQFFVDSAPKLVDVKTAGAWKTYLVVGEGPGGTFYQAFDVTLAGMAASVAPDSDSASDLLSYFSNPSRIAFKWSFPSYQHFDWTISPYGDVAATASDVEKTVGETWSDPAVGQVQDASGRFVVLVGSGFLSYTKQTQANRFPSGSKSAGTIFYMLDVSDGSVLDSRDVGNDGLAETVDSCAAANDCTKIKNALQADPVAMGPPDSRFITSAYIGDLDGRLWRFPIALNASKVPVFSAAPTKLYDAGASQPLFSSLAVVSVGGTNQYIFFGTGSDLLPSNGVSQSYKLMEVLDNGASGRLSFSMGLEKVDGSGGDEKVSAYPAVAGDIVFFSTTMFYPGLSCALPDANIYAFTFNGTAAYDNTGDNLVNNKDTPKVKVLAGAGRATAPFVVDQHLAVSAGGKVQMFGDPEDYNNGVGQVSVRILSWRERR